MDKLFLFDAYALIYRSYYAFIKNPRINSKGLNTSAVMGFCNTLHEVLQKEQPKYLGVAFDPHGPTFRNEAYEQYKAQREETPEDIRKAVPIIKDILAAMRIPVLEVAGYEADDVVGTLAKKADKEGIDTYMLTPDKDYGQLVGGNVKMFRPRHGGGYETLDAEGIKEKYGIEVRGEMFDTMIAHYLIQPELRHNMDYMAEIYLDYQTIHIEELIGPKGRGQKNMRDLTPEQIYEYAAEDADITLQLKNKLEPELKRFGAEDLFYNIEMPLMPVLAEMEMNGVRIDTESLKETSGVLTSRMKEIESRIYDLAGTEFNIASPKQVGEVLFDRLKIVEKAKKTKTGQYVTNEEVLQSLKHKHEIVADILEHRGLKKLLGTYVDALPKLINPRTGHIHTSFNQTVTATGRLSSSDPNLQNIPVRGEDGKEIRKAFIPEPGCEFFSADYSQIELRVMAHLSGDENMIEAFREGHDIHAATAAKIYKEDINDVSRDQRTKAKRANFGIIYGITVFGLAERLEISRDEAKQLISGYFETFPKVKEYMDKSILEARAKGYAETLFHRRRYLADINSHNATVRGFAERNAINAPIQGTAADIIKVAMIRIHRRFKAEGILSKMILQVHDELNFSVVPEEHEKVERIVMEEMQNAFKMQVPLVADSGWGKNWLEAH